MLTVSSWGFKLRGTGFPRISAPTKGKTMHQIAESLEVQENAWGPLSPCEVSMSSDFTRHYSGQKHWVFLYVCLSHVGVHHACGITLVNNSICVNNFALKALEYINNFDTIEPAFNFFRLLPTGDTIKCRSPKNSNIWVFCHQRAKE